MDHKHHQHHAHHAVENVTSQPNFTTTSAPASTLVQALLTTVMAHTMHHEHKMAADSAQYYPTESPGHVDHSSHTDVGGHGEGGDHMIMYFHSGVDAIVLFKGWTISSTQGMIGSVIGIFIMAMLYEGIKFFREYMFKRYFTSLEYSSVSVLADDGKTVTEVHKVARNHILSWPHFTQTFLHVLQMVISYFLMLIFMTYNVWLCLGVVLGAGTGYFLFGWRKATVVDITEHCH